MDVPSLVEQTAHMVKGYNVYLWSTEKSKNGVGVFSSLYLRTTSTKIWEEVVVGDDEWIWMRPHTGDVKTFIRLANEKIFTQSRNRLSSSHLNFPYLLSEMPPYLLNLMIERHLKDQNDELSD